MKAGCWLMPASMLLGAVPYTLIREQLPQNNKLLPILLTLLLFALTAAFLRRTCSRRTAVISAAALLGFCVILTALALLLSRGIGSQQFTLGSAYLWEVLFFPYLALPLPNVSYPLAFLLPTPIPFAWAVFCKPAS